MPVLQNFLCCISLRKGALILAFISIALAMITAVKQCFGFYGLQNEEFMDKFKLKMMLRNPHWQESDLDALFARIKLELQMNLALAVITIICASLLLHGALKNRRYFIIPYLICSGFVVLYLGFFCCFFIYLSFNPTEGPDTSLAAAIIAFCYFVALLVQVYLWLCVYSLFQWIKEQQLRAQFPQQPLYMQQQPYNPAVTYSPVTKV